MQRIEAPDKCKKLDCKGCNHLIPYEDKELCTMLMNYQIFDPNKLIYPREYTEDVLESKEEKDGIKYPRLLTKESIDNNSILGNMCGICVNRYRMIFHNGIAYCLRKGAVIEIEKDHLGRTIRQRCSLGEKG